MRPSKPFPDVFADDGSASVEFVTAGLLLLVPIVYLVLAMSVIQGGALSVEGASRQAARVYVQAPNLAEAQERAQLAVDFALADYGLVPGDATVTVTCEPNPTRCLTRRGFVTVTVTARVPLPLAPSALNVNAPFAVPLAATATQQVSRFWGAG